MSDNIPVDHEIIDISSGEDEQEEEEEQEDSDHDEVEIIGQSVLDNESFYLDDTYTRLRSIQRNSIELSAGITIAVIGQETNDDTEIGNEFFHIRAIFEKQDGSIVLQGWRLLRWRACRGMPHERNEVAVVISARESRGQINLLQYYHTIDLPPLFVTREIVFTNDVWPENNFTRRPEIYTTNEAVEDFAHLTCRCVYITLSDVDRPRAIVKQHISRDITEDECRAIGGITVRDKIKRLNHHGHGYRLGPPYTFGDICSGGGGSVAGAIHAGLHVRWCLDQDEGSIDTLRLNVGRRTRVLHMPVQTFATNPQRAWMHCTIMHVSFPCCFFSIAHTRPGRNDVENLSIIFSLGELIKKVLPRFLTFENVPGMYSKDGREWLYRINEMIRHCGYSLQESIEDLSRYGVPQARKRLIIIASAPGETLPTPVPRTHGQEDGLRDFTTVAEVLTRLEGVNIPHHMNAFSNRRGRRYNAHRQLHRCLTTTGRPTHPNGQRSFTLQEVAALQTFPLDWQFAGGLTAITRQVGNAVPSISAQRLFEHIVRHLTTTDTMPDTSIPIVDLTLEDVQD